MSGQWIGRSQLPSPPRQLTAINTTLNTISLTWLAPAQQPEGVTGYLVEYHQAKLPGPWLPLKTSAPHVILQNLDPDTEYVIRVSAYNDLGESLPSYRLVQQTLTTPGAEKSLNFTAHINIEACCREKNVLAECMPACNNSASVTYKQCHLELPKLVVCSADGRDHSDCCKRREVPANCLGFCQGSLPKSAFISYLCMASLPQILTCFRVGLPMLPSPPRDFHLVGQGSRWLQFAWTQPVKNGHDVRYSLQYQESINDDIAWINTIDNIRTVQHKLDHLLPFHQYTVRVQAVNRFGNSVPSAKVVVWTLQETPLRVSISQAPPGYIREHATSVTLTCQAVGDPPPFIHWLRNGVIHNDSTYSLQGVRHSDTGRYTCVARNNIGKVSSLDHYIKIQFLPKVVANVTQITRSPGQVLLTCGFHGYPERISWSRDGQNITGPDGWHDRRFVTRVIDEKVGIVESRLTIVLATKSDYGTYLCRAENDFGAVDALLMLKDNSEEHIEPFQPTTKYSSLSECCEARGVSVKCRVACSFDVDLGAIKDALMNPLVCVPDLPAIIQCGADGKDHSQCCRNNSVPAECLAVCAGNVDALTSGHIACIAHIAAITSCMETGQKNIPSPPRNVKALLSHGYISVSWDAPAKNRDKVTFYKVNYRRATVGPTLQVKLGPQSGGVNLTRIHGHTQYYINVTSGNHHGDSAPSDTVVITTLELMPSSPRNFTGHVVDGMSVRLSWEMPIKNPGAILGYLITYAVSGAHTRHTENISDVLTYKLENLAPQTTYTIFVRAQSSHFIGPRSKVITVATQASEGYFQQHFGGTTKVGLGIGLTFAVMVMVVVVGFALFWHIRKRAGSERQFEDSVAFENPTYTTAGTPRISGLPNGATSSLGSSTELVAGSMMKETDSSSSDQGYATLSTPTAPNKEDKTMATLHTSAASDV
ncbi:Contactin-5 [Lamellibrachia satsuma]|nr:Contactin-5 [Lamellibrachia satsuma]